MKLSRGQVLMIIGFGILFVWSLYLSVRYCFFGGFKPVVITGREIYIGGQPILFNTIISLLLTSGLTIAGIVLDALNAKK